MNIPLLCACLALPLGALAGEFPAGSPRFHTSFDSVTKAAATSGKPMVVVFSASWCPPCQMMKEDVYPSAAVKALHDRFEWAYLDVDAPGNEAVANKFGVSSIPHIQFLTSKGKSAGREIGGVSANNFAKLLEKVLKKTKA